MQRPSLNDRINEVVEGVETALASEEVDADRIQIDTPHEPEVNPAIYRDVEALLFRGFLVVQAEINGVVFTFKSMNHHEFDYLQWISGAGSTLTGRSMDRYYNAFISYGIFTINGQNILPDRDKWVAEIEQVFSDLPGGARSKVIRYLSELNRRAADAITLTEGYQMEQASRFKWAQVQGLDLMNPNCTGIAGSERLGMNYAQLVWRALNYYEDLRDTGEREWDNAKFIGSCFAGKEVRKLFRQDKDRRVKERQERIERRDQLIRQVVLRETTEQRMMAQGKTVRIAARTAEELATQLEKDLRGEKDWHDMVVAQEEARMRAAQQARQQKLQDVFERQNTENPSFISGGTDAMGLTSQEVQQRIQRQRQLAAQASAGKIVHPEMHDERLMNFINKYGHTDSPDSTYHNPPPERSFAAPPQDPSQVSALPPVRPRGTPFRR